ncbi:aromatic amino acid hydroxylase [Chryseolinea sp. T2]|uniref:aromatic amino acid hydroxylase n=1 Tax=Chryseolinea sp. T2 TaxID=3129255 RepID=UPI00307847F6
MELNEVTSKLPKHLLQFVVDQPYNAYTPIDQAVWRYVMRRNCKHLRKIAHASYLHGLEVTGVEIDRIPTMYGMNRILKEIGWAAVAVDGFIPPGAFMEFTQYNVLVIAADIRTIEHIEYTPAPDIIHESAGHAPILAVPEFAEYLCAIGEAGAKAFSSAKDVELYEAIRHLSIIKEDPATKDDEVIAAERDIERIQQNMGEPSEMAQIRNLHWWTVEYGLIGSLTDFKLYGAGLLSSIGEAISCLKDDVKKLPYTLDAMNCNYDITKPQPQLFVTPDFKHLMKVLEEFKQRMAWKQGGLTGVQRAIESQQTSTLVFSSGLQLTGTIRDVIVVDNAPVFIRSEGVSALSYNDEELPGFGKDQLTVGFASPVGKIMVRDARSTSGSTGATPVLSVEALDEYVDLESLNDSALRAAGIEINTQANIRFQSGIVVEGLVSMFIRNDKGALMMILFREAKVQYQGKVLIKKSAYSMAVGSSIISAFAGAADIDAFEPLVSVPREKMHKIIHSDASVRLQKLYSEVRAMRETTVQGDRLIEIFNILKREFRNDWLLSLEVLELLEMHRPGSETAHDIKAYLEHKASEENRLTQLIQNGLALLDGDKVKVKR